MKILSVADIHGSQYRLNILLKNIKKYSPHLVVICGDITQFGPGDVAKNFLNQIPINTYAVHGNIDTLEVLSGIDDSKALNIHLKKINKNGFNFIGIGGGEPLPITSEFFIDSKNKKFISDIINKSTIIITHVPPYGLQDKVFLGVHSGSKPLRDIIDKYCPKLVLCGHIHENPGFVKHNETIIVNCSIGKRGGGALINIDKNIDVKMLD